MRDTENLQGKVVKGKDKVSVFLLTEAAGSACPRDVRTSVRNCFMDMRRRRCIATVVVLAAAGCASGGATRTEDVPAVTGGPEMVYVCDGGVRWVARYLSLSDRSLDFVVLTGPDGTRVTLPSVLSASGVRYSDDRQLTWWTHGTSARLDRRDANGQWRPALVNCNRIDAGK